MTDQRNTMVKLNSRSKSDTMYWCSLCKK